LLLSKKTKPKADKINRKLEATIDICCKNKLFLEKKDFSGSGAELIIEIDKNKIMKDKLEQIIKKKQYFQTL
jgi:hypothetical protein